ncbi:MAG: hypothetical protein O2955_01655 [Planctomycetota bacterium]|nr:hypothetical protein [Planctomycetota bacterium]MDA1211189.1 hypothetical protein [Planctomycetota bacterium]
MSSPGDRYDVTPNPPIEDRRVYVPHIEGVEVHIKADCDKEYCYTKSPGEDYYHLLVAGEIYVQRGHEKFCLNCALADGVITRDRIHWQRRESMMTYARNDDAETETIRVLPPVEQPPTTGS